MERFGDRVRKARVEQEITIAEVARHLGFTAVHLSDIERGKKNPPRPAIVREWAEFLDLDPDQMVSLAEMDVDTIKVRVNHNPRRAEATYTFARRLDDLPDDRLEQIMELLLEDSDDSPAE